MGNETRSIRSQARVKSRLSTKAGFFVVEGHRANIESEVTENESVSEKNLQS